MLGLCCPAVAKKTAGPQNGKLYTEEDWNNESKPDQEGGYRYSKVSSQAVSTQHSASPRSVLGAGICTLHAMIGSVPA